MNAAAAYQTVAAWANSLDRSLIVADTLYFLALINPVSKVFLLSSMNPPLAGRHLRSICLRSTAIAFLILLVLIGAGNYVLGSIFHVKLYSLSVAGGIILFMVGLKAVQQGKFYEEHGRPAESDIAIVPLAAPLIAGPATITGAISYASAHGVGLTMLCILIALIINMIIMLASVRIGHALEKIHATAPLIRITGLIVASVAVQMIFTGAASWVIELGVSLNKTFDFP
ncbi:MAG: MarC family protein [Candidatus Sumerlaeota bacterium]|nr:MarC family protein [Candidatus Sumerlaeota bacterium]